MIRQFADRVPVLPAVAAAVILLMSTCGQSTVEAGDEVDAGTTSQPDPATGSDPEPEPGPGPDDVDVGGGDGLQVTLTGIVSDTTLCPGNVQPCVTLNGDLTVDGRPLAAETPYRISGSLADGVLGVGSIEKIPDSLDWIADHCDEITARTEPQPEPEPGESDPIIDYQLSIPEAFAVRWISPRRIMHMGVVGEAEPHQRALDELGVGDRICVVGGFPRSDIELERVQNDVTNFINREWPEVGNWSSHREHHLGAVQVNLHQADATMLAALDERFGDTVILDASILVLGGSSADFEAAAKPGASSDTSPIGLTARCGPVVFDSIPPDFDGFEPVDEETQALLDATTTGELAVETSDFVPAYTWSVASRTDSRMVLFGRRIEGEEGYGGDFANFIFEFRDGLWTPAGWGGCSVEVDAPGFGSATTMLDPNHEPDPASTELHVLIRERSCAGGSAPVDREVVPVVTETDTSIEIVTLVEPVAGGATCPGNPWHPVVITLEQPLGDRVILDAQMPPPVERTWPPSQDDLNR